MIFLIDQQLPSRLSTVLAELGHEAVHVKSLGLMEASDTTIRARARELNAVIITKDEDFIGLAIAGPKIVRIRLGNCSNTVLFQRIREVWPQVIDHLTTSQLVEISFPGDAS